jgi:acyl carrier protein
MPAIVWLVKMDNIASILRTYIAQNILFSGNNYPHEDDASFLDEGIIDSMNLLGLVTFVEEQFGIKVDYSDILPENFDSISRLAAYIKQAQAKTVEVPK